MCEGWAWLWRRSCWPATPSTQVSAPSRCSASPFSLLGMLCHAYPDPVLERIRIHEFLHPVGGLRLSCSCQTRSNLCFLSLFLYLIYLTVLSLKPFHISLRSKNSLQNFLITCHLCTYCNIYSYKILFKIAGPPSGLINNLEEENCPLMKKTNIRKHPQKWSFSHFIFSSHEENSLR